MRKVILLSLLLPVLFLFAFCNGPNGENKDKTTSSMSGSDNSSNRSDHISGFVYHRFGNNKYPSTNISLDRFKAHLKHLKKKNYEVLTLGEALSRLDRSGTLEQKTAVLTVDDGYRSVLENGIPLMEKYGFPATIFINTEQVGNRNTMTWAELADLQERGFEIGNHSHSHAHFVNKAKGDLREFFRQDLKTADSLFRAKLGNVPETYAYPYGEYNGTMKEVLKERGYEAAVAQHSGAMHRGSDRYALPRFPMTSFYGKIEKFKEKASMHPLPVKKETPSDGIISSGTPPELKLRIEKGSINPSAVQCFVDGQKQCSIEVIQKAPKLVMKFKSTKTLSDRRTLYTITAPSKTGETWHWYSKLWIRPQKPE